MRLEREGERVRLITRGGCDWTTRYPSIVEAVRKNRQSRFVIGREVIIRGVDGARKYRMVRQSDQARRTISTPRKVPDGAHPQLEAACTALLELRNSQCSALRSTSGFCRPQCFSTRSCQRHSRPPQSSSRVPQLPNVSDASARSSDRSGATEVADGRRPPTTVPAVRPVSPARFPGARRGGRA